MYHFYTQKYKTCLAKQDQAGSYIYMDHNYIMTTILTKELDFEIVNLY